MKLFSFCANYQNALRPIWNAPGEHVTSHFARLWY